VCVCVTEEGAEGAEREQVGGGRQCYCCIYMCICIDIIEEGAGWEPVGEGRWRISHVICDCVDICIMYDMYLTKYDMRIL